MSIVFFFQISSITAPTLTPSVAMVPVKALLLFCFVFDCFTAFFGGFFWLSSRFFCHKIAGNSCFLFRGGISIKQVRIRRPVDEYNDFKKFPIGNLSCFDDRK